MNPESVVRRAEACDIGAVSQMAAEMWHSSEDELAASFSDILLSSDSAIFVLEREGEVSGFVQCGLRRDYVEGTESSPVGYLEGIFVSPLCRGQGFTRRLLAACEGWAREKGCTEFASDCELTNSESLRFHLKAGFFEANRIICFTKKI